MIDHDTLALHRFDDDGAPAHLVCTSSDPADHQGDTCPVHELPNQPLPVSYRIACYVMDGSDLDGPVYNGIRFRTLNEAYGYGRDLYARWTLLKRWEIEPTMDPVTYHWDGSHITPVNA